jgi:hypothetical protein
MQKRFCDICGFPVWVQYQFSEKDNQAIFWSKRDTIAVRLEKCPCCWEKFNIDSLA